MSNRRTFPSISQPPPQGTIHLRSIFTPLHMFPFQPRIIFYHQITVVIRWSRCDSEQNAHPLLSPFPSIVLSSQLRASWELSKCQGMRRNTSPAAGFAGWDQSVADSECLGAGQVAAATQPGCPPSWLGKLAEYLAVACNLLAAVPAPSMAPHCPAAAPWLCHQTQCPIPAPAVLLPSDTSEGAGTREPRHRGGQEKCGCAATRRSSTARPPCDESSPSPCLLQSATNESLPVQG